MSARDGAHFVLHRNVEVLEKKRMLRDWKLIWDFVSSELRIKCVCHFTANTNYDNPEKCCGIKRSIIEERQRE